MAKKTGAGKAKSKGAAKAAKTGTKEYATRADLGAPASVAIDRMAEPMRAMARALDASIRSVAKGVQDRVAWGNAGYLVSGKDLFAISECSDRVNLYVGNGALLDDPDGVLEGTGKTMRHIKVRSVEQAESGVVKRVLKAAVAMAKEDERSAWK